MSSVLSTAYDRLPERGKDLAARAYYTVNPRLSWRSFKRMEEIDDAFVDRFFEDEAEFERYRGEFEEGPIVGICQQSEAAVPEGATIYDSHRSTCMKLYSLIRKRRPETLVETGVYNGVSTLSILLALAENDAGRLHSIDYSTFLGRTGAGPEADADRGSRRGPVRDVREAADAEPAGRGGPGPVERYFRRGRPSCADHGAAVVPGDRDPGWIIPEDLRDRWDLTIGRSQRKLVGLLGDLGEVDLFLHDSELSTSGMLFEFELAWAWLSDGGLLLSTHVDQNDAFETFVGERGCEHGIFDYVYDLGYASWDYTEPCSSGYVVKS